MISVLLSEMARPNAPKTSTKTAIIRPSPRVDRDTMHASSAYSIPQIARRTHSSAVSGYKPVGPQPYPVIYYVVANPGSTWSQRGTKVNGLHHGDNPLLRPTGIQIATKYYATLHAIAPTNNNKTVHQTSFLYFISRAASIDSDCCRLPTTSVLGSGDNNNDVLDSLSRLRGFGTACWVQVLSVTLLILFVGENDFT